MFKAVKAFYLLNDIGRKISSLHSKPQQVKFGGQRSFGKRDVNP